MNTKLRPSAIPAMQPILVCVSDYHAGRSASQIRAGTPTEFDYRLMRGPVRPLHRRLTDLAERWAASLPEEIRPHALLMQYPRVANRIALCWSDEHLTRLVLAGLEDDPRRSGRRGFPRDVAADIRLLAAYIGRS